MQGNFKIQSDPIDCNSEKVVNIFKCKVCGETRYLGKAKTKFQYKFKNHKQIQSFQENKPKNTTETFPQLSLSRWSFRN